MIKHAMYMENNRYYCRAAGKAIRHLRKERNMTGILLAKMCNVSRALICRVEYGQLLSTKVIFSCASIFGMEKLFSTIDSFAKEDGFLRETFFPDIHYKKMRNGV